MPTGETRANYFLPLQQSQHLQSSQVHSPVLQPSQHLQSSPQQQAFLLAAHPQPASQESFAQSAACDACAAQGQLNELFVAVWSLLLTALTFEQPVRTTVNEKRAKAATPRMIL